VCVIKTCGVAFFGAFLLLLFGLLSIGAEELKREPCKGNPALVGPCMAMRGRIGFANGAYWAKIWKVGTQRMLGIHRDIPLPQNLHDALSGRWDVVVFGDFVVCPLTPDIPGHMQSVCVESAAHLRVKKQDDLSRNP